MSKAERTQLSLLTMIVAFAERGYFLTASKKIKAIGEYAIDKYSNMQPMTAKDYEKIKEYFGKTEAEIEKFNYQVNQIFMLSIALGITSHFGDKIKNPEKVELWDRINEACEQELSKNYDNFTEEIDKADEIVDVLLTIEV